jgi:hypothetical protein
MVEVARPVSRRTLLKAGGAALGLGGLAAAGLGFAAPASAALPTSQYFDLSQPSYDFFARNRPLHGLHHAMQGMAFDNVNRRLFVIQQRDGSTGDDLCVNQLDLNGNLVGYMLLENAGHGVSIGVEPVGTASYLWTEADSSSSTDSGRGTALQRFKFVSGQTPSSVRKFFPGSTNVTCATDPVNQRILIRRSISGTMHFTAYSLAAASAGDFSTPLTSIAMPSISGTFQGYTFYGKYLYVLTGEGHADSADIDSKISCIDLNSGAIVQNGVLTRAGSTLVYREPEGMAIYKTSGGDLQLCFGFASRDTVSGINRYANVFYKDVLIG